MLANRRKSERRLCRRIAKIHWGTGSLPRDCTITDISDGGVKVVAELLEIPQQFRVGHEAHFAQVANRFSKYVAAPESIPSWETPGMLAKYYVSTKGTEMGVTQ